MCSVLPRGHLPRLQLKMDSVEHSQYDVQQTELISTDILFILIYHVVLTVYNIKILIRKKYNTNISHNLHIHALPVEKSCTFFANIIPQMSTNNTHAIAVSDVGRRIRHQLKVECHRTNLGHFL